MVVETAPRVANTARAGRDPYPQGQCGKGAQRQSPGSACRGGRLRPTSVACVHDRLLRRNAGGVVADGALNVRLRMAIGTRGDSETVGHATHDRALVVVPASRHPETEARGTGPVGDRR